MLLSDSLAGKRSFSTASELRDALLAAYPGVEFFGAPVTGSPRGRDYDAAPAWAGWASCCGRALIGGRSWASRSSMRSSQAYHRRRLQRSSNHRAPRTGASLARVTAADHRPLPDLAGHPQPICVTEGASTKRC
jgi:hypothetical protein